MYPRTRFFSEVPRGSLLPQNAQAVRTGVGTVESAVLPLSRGGTVRPNEDQLRNQRNEFLVLLAQPPPIPWQVLSRTVAQSRSLFCRKRPFNSMGSAVICRTGKEQSWEIDPLTRTVRSSQVRSAAVWGHNTTGSCSSGHCSSAANT